MNFETRKVMIRPIGNGVLRKFVLTIKLKSVNAKVNSHKFYLNLNCHNIRGVPWKAPKSMWKMFFSREAICILFWKWEKWGISQNLNIKNRGISKKKHVTCLKTRNEPKMKVFDFGAFQNKMHMASREKTSFTYFLGHFMVPRVVEFQNLRRRFSKNFEFQTKNVLKYESKTFVNLISRDLQTGIFQILVVLVRSYRSGICVKSFRSSSGQVLTGLVRGCLHITVSNCSRWEISKKKCFIRMHFRTKWWKKWRKSKLFWKRSIGFVKIIIYNNIFCI